MRSGQLRQVYEGSTQEGNNLSYQIGSSIIKNRPPYEAWFFAPFSFLPFRLASYIFLVLNLALIALSLHLLMPYFENFQQIWEMMPAALFFLFLPVAFALTDGRDSIILFTLMVAAAVRFYRNQDWIAGVFLGLGLFEPQFVIPVAFIFLLFKRWRIFIGFLISGGAVALVSIAMIGNMGIHAYFQTVSGLWFPVSLSTGEQINNRAIPNLHYLFAYFLGPYLSPNTLLFLIGTCSIALILWAGMRTANFALATMVAVLVSYSGSIGDAVLLLLPVAFVLDARLAIFRGWRRTLTRNVVGLLFIAPTLLYLAHLPFNWLVFLMLPILMPLRFASSDWQPRVLATKT